MLRKSLIVRYCTSAFAMTSGPMTLVSEMQERDPKSRLDLEAPTARPSSILSANCIISRFTS